MAELDLNRIGRILSIHHRLAMGEVVLLSAPFKAIKEILPGVSISIVASEYACDFLRYMPWMDQVVPIERFGIFPGKTSRIRRALHRPFVVSRFERFLRENEFDCVFMRNDERQPGTRLMRAAVERSGVRQVVFLKSLMEKHLLSSRHVVRSYLAILRDLGFGVGEDIKPVLSPTERGTEKAGAFLRAQGISADDHRLVGICPTSNIGIKGWRSARVSALHELLTQDGSIRTLLFSTDGKSVEDVQQSARRPLPVIGRIPFDELVALIARCAVFVSVDTGLMHVAAALGIPTIGIFGPTSGTMFGPLGENCRVLQRTPDCPHYRPDAFFSGEDFQQCYLLDRCLIAEEACTDLVSAEEVKASVLEML